MARHHIPVLLIILCGFAATAGALAFNVGVAPDIDHAVHNLSHQDETGSLQTVTATVENAGSVGCTYRMDATVRQDGDTATRSSAPRPLFPGAAADVSLPFIAYNTTGPVDVTVNLTYCERTVTLDTFTYEMTGRVLNASTMESTTETVSTEAATVSLPVDDALLVPRDAPPLWHPAPASVVNGTATVRYDPPLFNDARTLQYSVVNRTSGALIAETSIALQAEETWQDRLLAMKWQLLLALSLLANLALLLVLGRHRIPRASRVTHAWKHFKQSRRN